MLWPEAKCRVVFCAIQTSGQSLIGRKPRTSVVMQFVEFLQVSDRCYLQLIEIIFAGITKIGDVARERAARLLSFSLMPVWSSR